MYLDPKVDPSTASKILYHAGLAGRLDDIVIVSVSRSDNPYNSTFNPLSGFYDPSQIGNILAGLMPEDAGANQYFLDDARNIGRIVGTTVHWINQFLAILCDRNELGFHPPRLLLWLQYARSAGVDVSDEAVSVADKRKHVDTAYTAFTGIWQRLQAQDRSFIPASETERTLFTMWCQPEYTPRYWKLSFHHLLEFALNNRQRLLSWYMRIVYPYVCMTDERFADVLFPRSDTHEMVTGFNPRPRPLKEGEVPPPPLIELFEKSRAHLLSPGALNLADRTKTMWSYLYERDIDVDQVEAIQQVLVRSERSFSELLGQVKRDPEEYGQGVANLRPIVNEIVAGEKFDLLCVPEPQCTWPVIHQQKKIAIFMLGSMTDQKASDHVSRAIVQSLLAYAGYLQDRASPDMDLLFVGDEAFSWMNTTWASIVDKCRSTGIRTMALCQTLPGMRHAIKSADLFKHISGNVRNVFTCATNLKEDQDAMIEGVATFPVYRPQRNLSEQPAAAGEAAQVSIAGWGTSESWTFVPDIQPLMEPQHIGALPKGVFVQRVQKEFTVFQAPLLKEAPFTLHAFLGLDGNPSVLVEGVHYDVTDKSDRERMRTWATDERLAQALGRKDMMDPDDVVAIPSQAPFGFHHLKVDPRDLGIAVAPTAAPVTQADPPAKPKAAGRRIPLTDPVAGEDLFASASQALPVEDGNELEVDPEEDLERRAAEHAAMADAPPGLSLVEQEIDGLCARGAIDANGQRTGHWFLFTAGNVPAGDGFYDADIRVGMWEFRDASGAIARRATYAEGALVTEEMVQPPSPVPLTALPPGPLPKPIVVDEKDAEGLRYRGLMRENGLKVGTWEVFRADGTRSEVQHFHMVTGKPVGIWERYDEHGDLADTYSPA